MSDRELREGKHAISWGHLQGTPGGDECHLMGSSLARPSRLMACAKVSWQLCDGRRARRLVWLEPEGRGKAGPVRAVLVTLAVLGIVG